MQEDLKILSYSEICFKSIDFTAAISLHVRNVVGEGITERYKEGQLPILIKEMVPHIYQPTNCAKTS